VFALRGRVRRRAQGPQASTQGFIGHHDRSDRAGVDRAVVAVQGDDVPFVENHFSYLDGTSAQVDAQAFTVHQTDLSQLPGHHRSVCGARTALRQQAERQLQRGKVTRLRFLSNKNNAGAHTGTRRRALAIQRDFAGYHAGTGWYGLAQRLDDGIGPALRRLPQRVEIFLLQFGGAFQGGGRVNEALVVAADANLTTPADFD